MAWLATVAWLLWGTPAFAGGSGEDFDGDGVSNHLDNCSNKSNAAQDDTDADYCGNYCDADYNQDGRVNVFDLNTLRSVYLQTGHENQCHFGVIPGCTVNVFDLNYFRSVYLKPDPVGPSGTTPSTIACP